MQKVDAEKSSARQLWRSIDVLLGHDFFDTKVGGVRSSTDGASPPSFTQSPAGMWSRSRRLGLETVSRRTQGLVSVSSQTTWQGLGLGY